MPLKIFAPPLDTAWRLTADWTAPKALVDRYGNDEFVFNITGDLTIPAWEKETGDVTNGPWTTRFHEWKASKELAADPIRLPKGTVIVFDRYHISHSGDHAITCRVLASPELRFVNKKNGGKGKGKMRFYLHVEELNTFPPVEQVDDIKP